MSPSYFTAVVVVPETVMFEMSLLYIVLAKTPFPLTTESVILRFLIVVKYLSGTLSSVTAPKLLNNEFLRFEIVW